MSIDQALDLLSRYGWPVMAIIGSPLMSWRVTQWFKLCFKRAYHKKPSTLIMDMGSFCTVLAVTYWAWSIHSDNALFVSVAVACFHTAIVKALFSYAPKKLSQALQYGSDNDSTIMTVFVGKDRRSKNREVEPEDMTQPRQ